MEALESGAFYASMAPVLDDIVAQARRGSAILERFRNWSRPQRTPALPIDLRDTLRNVHALLAPEAVAEAADFIDKNFGDSYHGASRGAKKPKKNVQDAHEAIRPSSLLNDPEEIKDSLDKDQYSVLWVEHRDKGRLELNFLIPNTELLTGRRLQPYYDRADRPRIDAWQTIVNGRLGLHDPNAPENRRALARRNANGACESVARRRSCSSCSCTMGFGSARGDGRSGLAGHAFSARPKKRGLDG